MPAQFRLAGIRGVVVAIIVLAVTLVLFIRSLGSGFDFMFGLAGIVGPALFAMLMPGKMRMGSDGVLASCLGANHFFAFRDLRSARVTTVHNRLLLTLRMHDESYQELVLSENAKSATDNEELESFVSEIQNRVAQSKEALPDDARAVLASISHDAEIAESAPVYRRLAPNTDGLRWLASNSMVAAEDRVKALVALYSHDAPTAKRIAIAAEADIISPETRRVLKRIAVADDGEELSHLVSHMAK